MKIKKLIDRKAHEVEFVNIAQLEKKLIIWIKVKVLFLNPNLV